MNVPIGQEPGAAASERLSRYLAAVSERLRRAVWLRAAALLALAALLLTLAGSWLAIRTGFGSGTLTLVRSVLVLSLGSLSVVLLVQPLRRLRRERARAVEARTAAFDGRLQTFTGLVSAHPFKELLAQDALGIAARHPPRAQLSAAQLAWPATAAGALVLGLVLLAAVGPGLYRAGARAVWAGWLFKALLPAQRIDVNPGDQAVRRGANVTVRSWTEGFNPTTARLYARVGAGAWQQIDMTRGERGFEFTFYSLSDPVNYYIAAGGIRSPGYALHVVDVPGVDRLSLVYHYPAWTQKPPQAQEGNGDISAIAGTRVEVRLHTHSPLAAGELVLDNAATPLAAKGNDAQGSLTVSHDGRYFLAARIGGEQVRLTDDYLIKLLPLRKPEVHITWPGRDYSASSIEEVTTEVQASDDFGLQSLELRYSVNGGAWQTVPLPVQARQVTDQHVLSLESLAPQAQPPLAPGDLISYYAVARAHSQSAQSDMYFIDVQPFDRRYSQASAAAGGGGGDEQQQISQRQRQILLSTWNLLRQKQEVANGANGANGATGANGAVHDSAAIPDSAALLAALQNKLAAQAQSLAGRTQARELVAGDPKITRFIDSMRLAAKAMQPAAQRLAATDLRAAIAPEQQALQYLMRAAAQFTDVQVAMQRGGSGAASPSGRDVSQIYQLEMDLQKNQYESGNQASPESSDRQTDELARKLQNLAHREQQLADQIQRARPLTTEQRWQQQALQREAEDLQQQLNQLQQQQQQQPHSSANGSANNTAAANDAAGSPGRANRDGAAGAQGTAGVSGTLLAGRLQQAIAAMAQASAAMRQDGTDAAVQARRAVQEAQQALIGAGTQLALGRAQALQRQISDMAADAEQLYGQQLRAAAQLQAVARRSARPGGSSLDSTHQNRLTEQKRELSAGVQRLEDQMTSAAQQYQREAPQTSEALLQAARVLDDADLRNRLDIAAQYIDQGAAAAIAGSEGAVTQGLRELHERLQIAAGSAGNAVAAAAAARDPLAEELARVRLRREQVQRLAAARQAASGAGTLGTTERATLRRQIMALEQLELQLERREQPGEAIRAAVANPGAEQYQDAVADYYRQLNRQ